MGKKPFKKKHVGVAEMRRHFKERALEEYDLRFNNRGISALVRQINCKKARLLKRENGRRAIYSTSLYNQEIIVVYDFSKRMLVTCLKRGMRTRGMKL